jgi:hypothetical protein
MKTIYIYILQTGATGVKKQYYINSNKQVLYKLLY